MNTVCGINECTGCYACVNKCKQGAIAINDDVTALNAVIDTEKCMNCDMCRKVCPNLVPVNKRKPLNCYEGWSREIRIRKNSSSGGAASSIASAFIKAGGVCYSCVFKEGLFKYSKIQQIEEMQGSKYVKSTPYDVYNYISEDLKSGRKVLFIGLPCHVAGVLNYTNNHILLYTIDLICHGSPSDKLLSMFLGQYNETITSIDSILFRIKKGNNIDAYKTYSLPVIEDYYTFAFLKGLIYTENCYSCKYAGILRCSDLTLGDSWGSMQSKQEIEKGISIALCMSEKGQELLEISDLELFPADIELAQKHNKQLVSPTNRHPQRDRFYSILNKKSFNSAVRKCAPKFWIKQDIKGALYRLHIIRGGLHLTYSLRTKVRMNNYDKSAD